MGGALPFFPRDAGDRLIATIDAHPESLLAAVGDAGDARIRPAARITSGPYRHAHWCGPAVEWSIAELASLARSMCDEPPLDHPCPTPAPDGKGLPAGYTYFGQFLAHDLSRMSAEDPMRTAMPPAPDTVGVPVTPNRLVNHCTPRLDLQSLYGHGPLLSPEYYLPYQDWPGHLRYSRGRVPSGGAWHRFPGQGDDLYRNTHGIAVLPDARNDENVMISQIHLAIEKAHNRCLDDPELAPGGSDRARFLEARRKIQWHIQWLVLNDYLPRILHESQRSALGKTLCRLADGDSIQMPFQDEWRKEAWLPLEFVLAGLRFGHVLPRACYKLNGTSGDPIRLMPKVLTDPPEHHLAGGRHLPHNWTLDWNHFFDDTDSPCFADTSRPCTQYANRIAPRINPSLSRLPENPFQGAPHTGLETSDLAMLPFLTLLRGAIFGLPTGQALAQKLLDEKRDVAVHPEVFKGRAPLWYYLLAEAELESGGATLGRLGSEIVGSTLLGLIASDETSYLRARPGWIPRLGRPENPPPGFRYSVGTFLRYAW